MDAKLEASRKFFNKGSVTAPTLKGHRLLAFTKGVKPPGSKPFQKGQTGNPGGLPKGIARDEEAQFRAEVKAGGLAALRRIMATAPRREGVRIRASNLSSSTRDDILDAIRQQGARV
jgi:hypothetical protein